MGGRQIDQIYVLYISYIYYIYSYIQVRHNASHICLFCDVAPLLLRTVYHGHCIVTVLNQGRWYLSFSLLVRLPLYLCDISGCLVELLAEEGVLILSL